MKYGSYQIYKQAKLTFIGQLPEHWRELKASYGFERIGSGTTPKSDSGMFYGGEVPWITTSELRESVINDTAQTVTEEALNQHSALQRYPAGSIAIAMYGATIGRLGILGCEATVNQACCVFAAPTEYHPKFFYYWLWMLRPILISLSSGGGQPNLNQQELKQLLVSTPPLSEQHQIAAFLDWKTAQIDALIAKKRLLLDKLKEKRLAVITQAVTRGLDPDVPMRDSGIEWLGEVPAHWEVSRLKFFGKIGNGSTPHRENGLYWDGGDFPWLNSSVVNQETVIEAEQFVTATALKECHLPIVRPPAVLVGITGEGRTRGMATTLLIEATINQHLAYFQPEHKELKADFVRRFIDTAYEFLRSQSDGGGSTKGAITCWQISEIWIPIPPIKEQAAIVDLLESKIIQICNMATKITTAITHLSEYRTALITAATTGKIDVRDIKIPAEFTA